MPLVSLYSLKTGSDWEMTRECGSYSRAIERDQYYEMRLDKFTVQSLSKLHILSSFLSHYETTYNCSTCNIDIHFSQNRL